MNFNPNKLNNANLTPDVRYKPEHVPPIERGVRFVFSDNPEIQSLMEELCDDRGTEVKILKSSGQDFEMFDLIEISSNNYIIQVWYDMPKSGKTVVHEGQSKLLKSWNSPTRITVRLKEPSSTQDYTYDHISERDKKESTSLPKELVDKYNYMSPKNYSSYGGKYIVPEFEEYLLEKELIKAEESTEPGFSLDEYGRHLQSAHYLLGLVEKTKMQLMMKHS